MFGILTEPPAIVFVKEVFVWEIVFGITSITPLTSRVTGPYQSCSVHMCFSWFLLCSMCVCVCLDVYCFGWDAPWKSTQFSLLDPVITAAASVLLVVFNLGNVGQRLRESVLLLSFLTPVSVGFGVVLQGEGINVNSYFYQIKDYV